MDEDDRKLDREEMEVSDPVDAYLDKEEALYKAKKPVNVAAIVCSAVCLVAGVAGGCLVAGVLNKGAKCENPESSTSSNTNSSSIALRDITNPADDSDKAIKDSLDKTIDAYENAGGLFETVFRLQPFNSNELTAKKKASMVFNTFKNREDILKAKDTELTEARPKTDARISKADFDAEYKRLFGIAPSESDYANSYCVNMMLDFEYDAANSEYAVYRMSGIGGASSEVRYKYTEKYEVEGDVAFVTIRGAYIELQRYSEDATLYKSLLRNTENTAVLAAGERWENPINDSNKDEFTAFQYIFDKNADGDWILRGLYPMGAK